MMLKAVQQLNRWGIENIQSYCKSITTQSIDSLQAKGFWIENEKFRGAHLFGIRLPGKDLSTIKDTLRKNKIYVSFRGDAIRVAPNVYNDEKDMNRLVKILSR